MRHLLTPPSQNNMPPSKPIQLAALKSLTDAMPAQSELAGEFVRRMRDQDRY